MMRSIVRMLCLLVLTANHIFRARALMSELESRKVFNQELDRMAYDFQVKLQAQILHLESEIYSEVLHFAEEVKMSRDEKSDALRTRLAEQVAEVLEKFTKVMTYSTLQIQQLHDELNGVLLSVGGVADDMELASIFSPDEYMTATLYKYETTESERNRRHTLEWVPHDDSETTINSDPMTLPLEVSVDLSAFVDSGDDLDSQLREDWSHFVLRDYAPGLGSMASLHQSLLSHWATEDLPKDCLDLLNDGYTQDGVYAIYPSGAVGVEVWCDQTSDGGGWTVVVGRRADQSQVNFTQLPLHYTRGFGHPLTQHWIGLDHMEALTRGSQNTLRVQLLDHHLNSAQAIYTIFRVAGAEEQYLLQVGGYDRSSTAGDALTPHSGMPFSFPGSTPGECEMGVGWWFLAAPGCYQTLPTGSYHPQGHDQAPGGVEWRPWRGKGSSLHTLLLMTRRNLV